MNRKLYHAVIRLSIEKILTGSATLCAIEAALDELHWPDDDPITLDDVVDDIEVIFDTDKRKMKPARKLSAEEREKRDLQLAERRMNKMASQTPAPMSRDRLNAADDDWMVDTADANEREEWARALLVVDGIYARFEAQETCK
jgi:hypothetical protein